MEPNFPDDHGRFSFKNIMPIALLIVGVVMLVVSQFAHSIVQDTDEAVAGLVGIFLLIGGSACFLAGLISFFLKDEHQFWS